MAYVTDLIDMNMSGMIYSNLRPDFQAERPAMHSAICLTYDVDGGTDWRDSKEAIKALCFESMESHGGLRSWSAMQAWARSAKAGPSRVQFQVFISSDPQTSRCHELFRARYLSTESTTQL